MISLDFLDALCDWLRDIFKDYTLTAKDGSCQEVRVFPQFLPLPRSVNLKPRGDAPLEPLEPSGYGPADIEANFPCVIVRLADVTDEEEGQMSRLRCSVLFGVYDEAPDCQGYRDAVNLADFARLRLIELPSRILAKKFRLEMPLRWSFHDEQPWPLYFAQMDLTFEAARPLTPKNFDYKTGGEILEQKTRERAERERAGR